MFSAEITMVISISVSFFILLITGYNMYIWSAVWNQLEINYKILIIGE